MKLLGIVTVGLALQVCRQLACQRRFTTGREQCFVDSEFADNSSEIHFRLFVLQVNRSGGVNVAVKHMARELLYLHNIIRSLDLYL